MDKGKLVGIVTEHRLEQVSPSKATSVTVWELSYLLDRTPVREIMEKHIVTVSPDMSAEETVALAQKERVGSLLVVQDGQVVGIATTNDFFYKIVNPILGLGLPGSRVEISGAGDGRSLEDILSIVNQLGLNVTTLHIEQLPEANKKDVCVHVDTPDASQLLAELQKKGYPAVLRQR